MKTGYGYPCVPHGDSRARYAAVFLFDLVLFLQPRILALKHSQLLAGPGPTTAAKSLLALALRILRPFLQATACNTQLTRNDRPEVLYQPNRVAFELRRKLLALSIEHLRARIVPALWCPIVRVGSLRPLFLLFEASPGQAYDVPQFANC
jgi:hypothetical protein